MSQHVIVPTCVWRHDDRYSDTYIGCVGDVIKSFCSVAAETWQQKFDRKTLCPVLVSQNCLGWATQCREFILIYLALTACHTLTVCLHYSLHYTGSKQLIGAVVSLFVSHYKQLLLFGRFFVFYCQPRAVQSSKSLDIFRRRLKTELFERSYNDFHFHFHAAFRCGCNLEVYRL